MAQEVYSLRWGILGPGGIAKTFTRDLLLDPATRGVSGISHLVTAVGSSNSIDRSRKFIDECGCDPSTKAYGSYTDLVADPDIDIIYIATPHSHHYEQALLCLRAGKHILCEKPVTQYFRHATELVDEARKRNLFFMQAMWTRYNPGAIYVSQIIARGDIGTVYRVIADCSLLNDLESDFADGQHRLVNPSLAGGSLLDVGIYSLQWCFQVAIDSGADITGVQTISQVKPYVGTGVDESTAIILSFPRSQEKGGELQAISLSSIRVASDPDDKGSAGPCIRIQGSKGEIQVLSSAPRPTVTRVILVDGEVRNKEWVYPGPGNGSGWFNGFSGLNKEGEGHGMYWQADEVAFSLKEGLETGRRESLEEMLKKMEIMDGVLQK